MLDRSSQASSCRAVGRGTSLDGRQWWPLWQDAEGSASAGKLLHICNLETSDPCGASWDFTHLEVRTTIRTEPGYEELREAQTW